MSPVSNFHIPSTGQRVSLAQLKRLKKALQIEAVRTWFEGRYDTPVDLPYDSSEGGYQWIWGGPFEPEEELRKAFEGIVPDDVIEEVASDLDDIPNEWSGKPQPGDLFEDNLLQDLIASGKEPLLTLMASIEDIEDAASIKTGERELKTRHKLLFANVIVAFETFLGELFLNTLRKNDQYVEDFVLKTPHFQITQVKLSDIFKRVNRIDAEVRKYIVAHNWHMLKESALMYKRAFNIKFPETPVPLANGIRDRHDIVIEMASPLKALRAPGTWPKSSPQGCCAGIRWIDRRSANASSSNVAAITLSDEVPSENEF